MFLTGIYPTPQHAVMRHKVILKGWSCSNRNICVGMTKILGPVGNRLLNLVQEVGESRRRAPLRPSVHSQHHSTNAATAGFQNTGHYGILNAIHLRPFSSGGRARIKTCVAGVKIPVPVGIPFFKAHQTPSNKLSRIEANKDLGGLLPIAHNYPARMLGRWPEGVLQTAWMCFDSNYHKYLTE